MPTSLEIANDLRHRIASNEFADAPQLPAESMLATGYGAARGTVRRALEMLETQGLVTPKRGVGWILQRSRSVHSFSTLRSFAQWARSKGYVPGGEVVAMIDREPTAHEARRLRIRHSDAVLEVLRKRTLDGEVVMLERTTYPEWVAEAIRTLPADTDSVVRKLAEDFQIITAFGDHQIDAIGATSEDARLLGVRRSSPLLRVRRGSFSPQGRPIEVGDDRYVPGSISFWVDASIAQ